MEEENTTQPLHPKSNLAKRSVIRVKRHWLTIAFIFGFLFDLALLNKVDDLLDNLILLFYVTLSMLSLALLYAAAADKFPERISYYARMYAPLALQYAFGGLLSGMLIFYGRSGSLSDSWPYLMLILLAIYANETLKDRTSRFIYNLAILFLGLLSYVVLVIPVITGLMGAWIFIGSGLLALCIMFLFLRLLHWIVPRFITLHQKAIIVTIGTIFAGLNFLYFTNIIPPIPLSLKDVGVYHSVVRFENGEYQLKYEEGKWYQFFKKSDDTFHAQANDTIFCFAKVFAPTKIQTDIYHKWEYYSTQEKKWIEHARLSYPISGGRDSGFRGYTLIQSYTDGKWRCTVETKRGQVLGRETFVVDSQNPPAALETRTE